VGMPGCGKSTVGKLLAAETGRCFVDTDALIVERAGCSIPEIFARDGEAAFRDLEAQVVADTARESGLIVATGGGVLLREENRRALRQNSRVIFLERALSQLPSAGRPISQSRPIEEIYAERLPLYRAAADAIIANDGTPEETVRRILEV